MRLSFRTGVFVAFVMFAVPYPKVYPVTADSDYINNTEDTNE